MALREPTFFILTALADQPRHGYGVMQAVAELSGGRLRLRAGTLYAALDRLTADGLLAVEREETPVTSMSLAAMLACVLVAAPRPRPGTVAAGGVPRVPPGRYGARLLAGLHLAFTGAAAVVTGVFLAWMLVAGADRQDMTSGAYDPKQLVPFEPNMLNPAGWMYAVTSGLFVLGIVGGPALLTFSVPVLIIGRRTIGHTTYRLLLSGAVTTVALTALWFSPVGSDIVRWWLD